jgi:hypothetical protein
VGGRDADPRHAAACQRPAAWYGHAIGEDPGCTDHLPAIEHGQRPVELERLFRDGQLFIGWER